MKQKYTRINFIILGVILVMACLIALDIYKCPVYYFAGIPCPFCGMGHAFRSLLSGDFAGAFFYHPLWPVVVIAAVLFLLNMFRIVTFTDKQIDIAALIIGLMFGICFIIRHILGSPVVALHFEQSLIYHVFFN